MKRARRFPQRLVRWMSLCVCFALVLTSFVLFPSRVSIGKNARSDKPSANSGAQGNGQERRVNPPTPKPGPPAAGLPNLDDLRRDAEDSRRHGPREVHAPAPIPSTQRRWRHGQRAAIGPRPSDVRANHVLGAIAAPQGTSDMAMARIDPHNRTGTGGVDPLSNNFNWNLGLVGLKGRGGLDLGLSLSYNSLVWTRSGNYITYDLDDSTVAPGFRLDFPVIDGPTNYWNDQASTNFYLMITPSGARVELRYIGVVDNHDTYESQDSAHLQLQAIDSSHILVRPTDGTRMSFTKANGYWRCNEIKDRNGNFLTITHNNQGDLSSVTDTLNRTITVTYDGNWNIQTIDQTWNGQTHHWATFGWGQANIGNNFAGLSITGPNNTSIQVLTQVGLADGSYYTFDYTNGFGQVTKIHYNGGDARPLRYTTLAYSTNSNDPIPRVSEQRVWADWWNGMNNVPSEVVTYFGHDNDGACRVTLPDGTVQKEYYGSTWQSGLTTATKDYETVADANADSWKKRTTTQWTQDDNVSYPKNPRVTQTDIWDIEGNHRKTTISYGPYVQWSLPYLVQEYDQNGNVLRNTYTDYFTDPTQSADQQYLQQRIIGLVRWVHVSDSSGWQSKTAYGYDTTSVDPQDQAAGATQHDGTNYSASFNVRGNLTVVSRYDVTDITNDNKAHTSHMTYDAAGSVLTSSDPLGHQSNISYTDSFSADGVNNTTLSFATLAYPTTITDADGNSSAMKYHYDFGAVTRTQGPPPAGQYRGASQKMTYDSAGRLSRSDNLNNNAYVRWDYGSWVVTKSETIQDGAGESHTVSILNGFGSAVATSGDNPGSAGGSWAKFMISDLMGRPSQFTNPTEINSSWGASGDDAWLFSTPIVYDWKGRPRFTYNMDGTYKETSYAGCGCAGGEVVTLTDEGTLVNGVQQYRRQKIYSDPVGRQWKTEVLNWDSSVYSTSVSVYNGRDQVAKVKQYSGLAPSDASSTNANASCPSGTCQESAMTFDGYGRLQTKHVPEQQVDPNNSGSTDHTTYTYKDDDTINSVTDARGAIATYGYNNNRHLVSTISYSAPSGVTAPSVVSFGYDSVGNRTAMSDSSGGVTYHYDELSRMDWEEHSFSGLTGSFRLNYSYNLAGELTSIAEPSQFGASVGYQHDSTGRLTAVTGSGYTYTDFSYTQSRTDFPVNTFVSNIQYRAWGDMKNMDDGSGVHSHFDYNTRLQPSAYSLSNFSGSPTSMTWNYDYHADGNIHHAYDVANNVFDRAYSYDHAARLIESYSGAEASGGTASNRPYRESFSYDVWNNQLGRTGQWWQLGLPGAAVYSYTNNRRQGLGYDAAGHVTTDSLGEHTFDARGARILVTAGEVGGGLTGHPWQPAEENASTFDGNGQPTKLVKTSRTEELIGEGPETNISETVTPTYYLRSSVLAGFVINEIDTQGHKTKGYIYAGGERLAEQVTTPWYNTITWQHKNPMTGSWVEVSAYYHSAGRREMDPSGREVGITAPPNPPSEPPPPTRSPNYIENFGGQTNEAELGMQLYEDFYINKNYGGGAGPGQGDFWEQWHNHETEREFQLMTGGHFLFGIDRMNAGISGGGYELVDEGKYVDTPLGQDEHGNPVVTTMWKDLSYYRLVPGSGSPQKKLPLNVQFLRDPLTGRSYDPDREDKIRAIVNGMVSDPCTKAFQDAGLTPPSKLLENGIFIGPATLLLDPNNLGVMGTTEAARNRDVGSVDLYSVKAFTENDIPGYQPETVDGRPRIFLNRSAFQEGWDKFGDYLRHEVIHAGGAPPKDTLFSSDLAYLGWKHVRVRDSTKGEGIYQWIKDGPTEAEIIAACR